MILKQIEELQAAFFECRAVAFADISSKTVLCVSKNTKQPQERLDALCEAAGEFFNGNTALHFSNTVGGHDAGQMQECVVMGVDETLVFLRSPVDPAEALLCICAANIDTENFLEFGRSKLSELANAQ